MLSYLQAIVLGLLQGVTELFPISSLGHSVLVPAWIGGSWHTLVTQSAQSNSSSSFYLSFIVALHVATALALLWFFRADWVRLISGFFRSARRSISARRLLAEGSDERLAWTIIFATIPVGIVGLALESVFRTLLAKPGAAGIFLLVNGLILLVGERTRRRSIARTRARGRAERRARMPVAGGAQGSGPGGGLLDHRGEEERAAALASDLRISRLPYVDGVTVGCFQILALLAGISRSGVTMVGGLWRGLDHEDAARFAFLLATPVILAAGVLKLPALGGHAAAHIHGQIVIGFLCAGLAAYVSVRYLVRYFQTNTLRPFAWYCLLAGLASVIRFA
jgi:undecaprenyl-diphosphatase